MKTPTPESVINLLTKSDLVSQVESLVRTESMGYAEAIVHLCDSKGIDPEDVAKLVSGSLKEKLKAEAQRNHLLPKPNSLFGFA